MFRRPMDFAGSWYPRDGEACLREIERLGAQHLPQHVPVAPRFGVVPHAGWMYSGALAARVFQVLSLGAPVDVVVLLGGHLHRDAGLVAMAEGEWETPLGPFVVHTGFRPELEAFPDTQLEDESWSEADNSLEVPLPFARHAFPGAELLPLRVPPGPLAQEVGRRLAAYVQQTGLRVAGIASTDLTHYGPSYAFEPRGRGEAAVRWVREENDPHFIHALESGSSAAILESARRQRNACSAGAAAALNEVVRLLAPPGHLARFHSLGYATSLDAKVEPSLNFVGYVGGVYA